MILVAVLIVGAVAWLAVKNLNNGEQHPDEYTTHSAISIDGNGGFTNASGVVWGSGSASDPYIIANWDITEISPCGILIQKTDAHFIVRNCHVHGGSQYNGISLWLCVNGTLERNNCSNCAYGIALDSSSNNTLINNNCSSNDIDGIHLFSSSYNTLWDNNCSNNYDGGIYLDSASDSNEISWNQISNNGGRGVDISSGSNNRIWYNVIVGNDGATGTYNASHEQARDNGTNNSWNSTDAYGDHGNYWSDWITPDSVPPQGIVDQPYIILGSAGAKDFYPLSYNPLYIGISFIPSCLS